MKKNIEWKKDFKPTLFEDKEYESYYVWVDEEWEEKFISCNPDFNSQHYLTPINFRREVLDKYYANPDKYSVWDSSISMAWFWHLRIDNNLDNKIGVFLCDLWRDIPFSEQKYWKNFEIKEKWKISYTYYQRSFQWEFCDPETSELYFKYKYNKFNRKWNEKFWWKLFKEISSGDIYLLKSLHSLNSENNQKEFDEQILIITKILIDYLNEKEIYKKVRDDLKEKNDKWISKLDKFLISENSKNIRLIKFFRDLQLLISKCTAHQKWKDYKKALLNFWDETKSLKEVFDEILIQSTEMLNTLEIRFLK